MDQRIDRQEQREKKHYYVGDALQGCMKKNSHAAEKREEVPTSQRTVASSPSRQGCILIPGTGGSSGIPGHAGTIGPSITGGTGYLSYPVSTHQNARVLYTKYLGTYPTAGNQGPPCCRSRRFGKARNAWSAAAGMLALDGVTSSHRAYLTWAFRFVYGGLLLDCKLPGLHTSSNLGMDTQMETQCVSKYKYRYPSRLTALGSYFTCVKVCSFSATYLPTDSSFCVYDAPLQHRRALFGWIT